MSLVRVFLAVQGYSSSPALFAYPAARTAPST
jgi:hypothetical protein